MQKTALALLVPGVACAAALVKGGLYGQAGAPCRAAPTSS